MNFVYQRKAFVLLLWCILSALPLFGQAYGSISGTVLDPTSAAIAGVTVSVTERATGQKAPSKRIAQDATCFGFPVVMPNQPISAYVTLKIHLNKE